MGVSLYVGGDAGKVQRRRVDLTGLRCFTPSFGPSSRFSREEAMELDVLLDSGAFSDVGKERLTPEGALERQLRWEAKAAKKWECSDWQAKALVSYDWLIDEKFIAGKKVKQRWAVADGEKAVDVTIAAAKYLSSQRERLLPRRLVLATQGVDCRQYLQCLEGVLAHARSQDWIGLGGWCVLGKFKRWLPTFWATMRQALPMIAMRGFRHVHIFGVLYQPALGGLLWLADRHGLTVSTDSASPVLAVTFPGKIASGGCLPTWEQNVERWVSRCANLRTSTFYQEPPNPHSGRQLTLFGA